MAEKGATSLIDSLIERIPYTDGSWRRRLLAGAIVGMAAWYASGQQFSALVDEAAARALANPLVSVALAFLIYLAGTFVEIIGNNSLSRAAGGFMFAVTRWRHGIAGPARWLHAAKRRRLVARLATFR